MKILSKHIIILLGFLTINSSVFIAQQIPVYSQFFMNKYTQNPAFAGMDHLYSVTSNHRYQWVGLQDYPRTYTLSVNGPTKDLKNGMGAFLYTDNVGPTRRTGFQASYAYHTKINEQINVSLSLSAGLIEWKIDGLQLTFTEPNDPATTGAVMRSIMPDAKFGFLFYSDKWHAGGAAPNLLQNKIKFNDVSNPDPSNNKLEDHYFIHGGYDFILPYDLVADPYLLLRYVSNVPMQLEFGSKVTWKESAWAGFSYRSGDAFSMLLGYTYKNYISFGYSYDFTTSNLRTYSGGSHELLFRILFQKQKAEE
tara:strand:- start:101 stop:1024 length:924 start_codon:yes stop_codon:yes gene_type:complete